MLRDRGYTLVELLLALVLASVVAVAIHASILASLRFFRMQSLRLAVGDNLRTGVLLVQSELRELNPVGGDLVEMSPSSVTYRAWRSVSFICDEPDLSGREIIVARDAQFGLRPLEAGRDSVLVYSGADLPGAGDAAWISAGVTAVVRGALCSNGAPGISIRLAMPDPTRLTDIEPGAPARGYQVTRLRQYKDSRGQYWLGMSEWREGSGWSVTQPVLGPIAEQGFILEYLDGTGAHTSNASRVEQVRLMLTCVGFREIGGRSGSIEVRDSLVTLVSLRNRPRS